MVVPSESCPMLSLMTDKGIRLCFATLAHEWRAQCIVNGWVSPTILPISFNLRFMRVMAFLYCLLSSTPLSLRMGSR